MKELVGIVWLLVAAVGMSASANETTMTGDTQCPPWQSLDRASNSCKCFRVPGYFVTCSENPYFLQIQECYCMTHKQQKTLVGSCLYTCHRGEKSTNLLNLTADSMSELNKEMCGLFKRTGQMCGECIPGHAPPVYSYTLSCVPCTASNWGKYLAISLLPSTAFFVFVLLFRISATSPSLSGFILFNQILTCASTMRALEINLENRDKFTPAGRTITEVFVSISGVWNLDFFRLVYPPFCLQPDTNDLQVQAMDYLTAVYPLVLISLAYLLVLLYDRNVRFVVWLWKPVVPLFIRLRRQWNIKHSLVDAFATFLLLSYVKILSVSVDILLPTVFFDRDRFQGPTFSPFIQGSVSYFGTQHLPYACLALFFLLIFTLLPMALLFLYPCSCFQHFLNYTGFRCQTLHIFMDTFQGHYKNGTDGGRDLRFFSGIYLLIRGLVYASTALAYQISSYGYTTMFLIGFTAIVALARPFKKFRYNFSDVFFLAIITMLFVSLISFSFSQTFITEKGLMPPSFVLILATIIYINILLFYWIKTNSRLLKCWNKVCQKQRCLQTGRHENTHLLSS